MLIAKTFSYLLNNSYFRYLNEVELKQSKDIMIKSTVDKDDVLLTLRLDKLKLGDAGRVQIMANNSEGDVGSSARLRVKGEVNISSYTLDKKIYF